MWVHDTFFLIKYSLQGEKKPTSIHTLSVVVQEGERERAREMRSANSCSRPSYSAQWSSDLCFRLRFPSRRLLVCMHSMSVGTLEREIERERWEKEIKVTGRERKKAWHRLTRITTGRWTARSALSALFRLASTRCDWDSKLVGMFCSHFVPADRLGIPQ